MKPKVLWGIGLGLVAITCAVFIVRMNHKPAQVKPNQPDVASNAEKSVKTEPSVQSTPTPQLLYPRVGIKPVDQSGSNPDFKAFRDQLLQALDRKDVDFLTRHLDERLKYSFGAEEAGVKGFIAEWKLEQNPEQSELWSKLREVILLGGKFDTDGNYVTPYTFTNFPESEAFDCMMDMVAIDKEVKVYEKPSPYARVVDKLSYEVVRWGDFHKGDLPEQWIPVTTAAGLNGFVERSKVRSPIDYRAYFEKKDGEWMMTFFVNGD